MVRFGTAGIRGSVTDTVTPSVAVSVGEALGSQEETVVIGRDGRTSGQSILQAVSAGVMSAGGTVEDLGIVPTSTVAFASQHRAGIMVTASHNPPRDNGLKLFVDGEELSSAGEKHIETRIENGQSPAEWQHWGEFSRQNILADYRKELHSYLRELTGKVSASLSIAVDCGNGTGGLVTPQLLTDLGADVHTLNGRVDGHFPARPSKPHKKTLADVAAYVRASPVDCGFAHDGDADRIVVLDQDGTIVHEDTVLAILAHYYVSQSDVEDPVVVTTINASDRIDDRVIEAGGRVERTRLGGLHDGISDILASDPSASVVFAAEPWKHMHPGFGGWIDGIVSAGLLTLIIDQSGGIEKLRKSISERPYRKTSIDCATAVRESVMRHLADELERTFPEATIDQTGGIRLTWQTGWALLRPSGTEPKIRVYIEHDNAAMLEETFVGMVKTVRDERKA